MCSPNLRLGFACVVMLSVFAVKAECNQRVSLSQPDSRYEVVDGTAGAEVRDKQAGIVWQRCVLGMAWNGSTCIGAPIGKSWTDAMQLVQSAQNGKSVNPWRLPTHTELVGLAERACYNPSINTNWFPETPPERTWTSSMDASNADEAWHVSFSYGQGGHTLKRNLGRIRLVRDDIQLQTKAKIAQKVSFNN